MSWETSIVDVLDHSLPWAIGGFVALRIGKWFKAPISDRITASPLKGKVGGNEFELGVAAIAAQQAESGKSPEPTSEAAAPESLPTEETPALKSGVMELGAGATIVNPLAQRYEEMRNATWRLGQGWKYERIWRLIVPSQFALLLKLDKTEEVTDGDLNALYSQLPKPLRLQVSLQSWLKYLIDSGLITNTVVKGSNFVRLTNEGRLFIRFTEDVTKSVFWPTLASNNPWKTPDDFLPMPPAVPPAG